MERPRFDAARRRDAHEGGLVDQFGYANRQLRRVVRGLLHDVGIADGAVVLDMGCGSRPYEREVPSGARYLGADLVGNPVADLHFDDDGRLPLDDASVDVVLSTQVLEHVRDVDAYLAEARRVLRPGGAAVVSTHGVMYYHRDPEDYWRWTAAGLAEQLSRHGLVVEDTKGVLGLASAGLQIFQDATLWKVPRLLKRPFVVVMQLLVWLTDRPYSEMLRAENSLTVAVRAVVADGRQTSSSGSAPVDAPADR